MLNNLLPNEKMIAELLEEIFTEGEMKTKYSYPNININRNKTHYFLINKFINRLSEIFNTPEKKRKTLYSETIDSIKNNNKLIQITKEVKQRITKIDIEANEFKQLGNLYKLYKITLSKLDKQNQVTINDLIDQSILHIGFISKKHTIIKYIVFCLIKNMFLKNKEKKEILFNDCQIDDKNEICINLIIDLLNNKISDNLQTIISYVILRCESFKTTIKNYDLKTIQKAAKNSIKRIESQYSLDSIISVEKIVVVFIDEYEYLLLKEENDNDIQDGQENQIYDNKDINDIKEKGNLEDYKKEKETDIIQDNGIDNKEKLNNQILDNKNQKIKIIGDNSNQNIINNNKQNYKRVNINIFNEIINKINMDEKSRLELRNLFENMNNRINELEKEVKESKNNSQKFEKELKNNSQRFEKEIKESKEKINLLNVEVKEIKNILGKIQCREQAKTFLNGFNQYLEDEDKEAINNNKTKGDFYKKKSEIIEQALKKKFNSS